MKHLPFLCSLLALHSTSLAQTTKQTVENGRLRVQIDSADGSFVVVDKRIGHTWASAKPTALKTPELPVPRVPKVLSIDGDLGDWGKAAEVRLTPDMVGDAKRVTGVGDLSATVRLCWAEGALYLGAEVQDEKIQFAKSDEDRWWFWDSIEFWVGASQCALRLNDEKVTFWCRKSKVQGLEAKVRRTTQGYVVEARVPMVGLAGTLSVGKRFRFAVGINDSDAAGGKREGQLYYPDTWRHSRPQTFALVVLGDAKGTAPRRPEPVPTSPISNVQPLEGGRTGMRFTSNCRTSTGQTVTALMTLCIEEPADLVIDVDLPNRDLKLSRFQLLPPLPGAGPDAVILWPAQNDGLAVPVTELSWNGRWSGLGTRDQPWVGLIDGDKGYLIIGDTPDDLEVRLRPVRISGRGLLAPHAFCAGSKGTFRYARRLRYSFIDNGGIVGAAKRFRAYAKARGLLRTLKEKMKARPAVALLAGAPDIWGNASLQFILQARTAGMDRAIINGSTKPEDMETIKSLGYLISKYDNYEDCMVGHQASHYADVKVPDDCPLLANGKRMKGWLTFDKKKQFMKRCSVKQVEVARRWIPKDLAKYPYNARFLDVTTATGLRECYDPNHGCTRAQDREAKRALAKYVGEELGLVLGGEHGRWWGADLFDYWEGMQSGGAYSWPAGHVGKALPEKREDIGRRYLEWGLGHRVRVPLWELVFGDCVVCTWYWGDSTGHLYNVAPELAAKKDAFNILYATVPLYWVSRPFSFNWNDPELRARLLESYRNTCKLHEVIGFEEMTSFEYVTPERDVQRTRFADGTVVTVNFGDEPYALTDQGQTYQLPQFGFLARGPRIFQYRALAQGRALTEIRKDNYIFCDGAGQVHDFGAATTDGRVTLRQRTEGLFINVEKSTAPVLLHLAKCVDNWQDRYVRLFALNEVGKPSFAKAHEKRGDTVTIDGDGAYWLIYGEAGAKPDFAVSRRDVKLTPAAPKQGDQVLVSVRLHNAGGPTGRVTLAVYMDTVGRDGLVAEEHVDMGKAAAKTVDFRLNATEYDGLHSLIVVADANNEVEEVVERDNRVEVPISIAADWDRWPHHVDMAVTTDVGLDDWPVSADVDLSQHLKEAALEAASVRVAEVADDGALRPTICQWEPSMGSKGTVWWTVPGQLKPNAPRQFRLLFAPRGHARFRARKGGWWDEDAQEVVAPHYRAGFVDGAIRSMRLRYPGAPTDSFLRIIAASSQATKWSEPEGKVTSLEVRQDGPVRCVVHVGKDLPADHHYEKTYEFYPSHFVVTVDVNKPLIYSRAFYNGVSELLDDKGHRATIDGKGDGEGITGRNPNPQWYQVKGEGWAQSCVALTPFANISYWDPGGGQVGFNDASKMPCRVGYVMHAKPTDERFGAEDAARLRAKVEVTVATR